jgi:hypothetical protein
MFFEEGLKVKSKQRAIKARNLSVLFEETLDSLVKTVT